MKNVVLVDFPEQWPSLLPQLTQNLQSQVRQKAVTVTVWQYFKNIVEKHAYSVFILATRTSLRQMQIV